MFYVIHFVSLGRQDFLSFLTNNKDILWEYLVTHTKKQKLNFGTVFKPAFADPFYGADKLRSGVN